jgi:5-hydroxyisourate hydrolase
MDDQPTISTHVLDVGGGTPGAGFHLTLHRVEGEAETWAGHGTTDADGRIHRLLEGPLIAGEYRIEIVVGAVFLRRASITFNVDDTSRSYHVPFLISAFSLSTYRGS